jgi:hypothetical protein
LIASANKIQSERARLFCQLLENLIEPIRALRNLTSVPENNFFEDKPEQLMKIQLNCSGSFLGAMLRMLVDNKIIITANLSAMIRLVTQTVNTARQMEISVGSLRNAFSAPRIEILEQLLYQLKEWVVYLEQLIEHLSK